MGESEQESRRGREQEPGPGQEQKPEQGPEQKPDPGPFAAEDTHTELMAATYAALQNHGYADLTMQRIGEEFPKSKSLVYQHYDGKDDLLVAFLEHMLDALRDDLRTDERLDPPARLRGILDRLLPQSVPEETASFHRALTALRGQATHDSAFRSRFTETDRLVRGYVTDAIRDGVVDGTFDPVDPDRVAAFVTTTTQGAMLNRATTDDAVDAADLRADLDDYLASRLGTAVATDGPGDESG